MFFSICFSIVFVSACVYCFIASVSVKAHSDYSTATSNRCALQKNGKTFHNYAQQDP